MTDSNLQAVAQTLGLNNARQIVFHAHYQLTTIPQCVCGQQLSWDQDRRCYRKFCSRKCTGRYTLDQRTQTNRERYGVDYYSQSQQWKETVVKTSIAKYQVPHYSQTAQCQSQRQLTNLKRYGVAHVAQNAKIAENTRATNRSRWGADYPMQSQEVRRRHIATVRSRYGKDNVASVPSIRSKITATVRARYGSSNPLANRRIHNRAIATKKSNRYSPAVLALLEDPMWLAQQNQQGRSVGEIAKQLGVSSSNLCKYFAKYGIEIKMHHSSSHERTVRAHLDHREILYTCNRRNIIWPYEIDIMIDTAALAIEINGAFWHHQGAGKDQHYHRNKWRLCQSQGIVLWQFLDWEIEQQLPIIKSMIDRQLNLIDQCDISDAAIVSIDRLTADQFFRETLLIPPAEFDHCFGAVDQGQLICAIAFARQGDEWRITGMAEALGCQSYAGLAAILDHTFDHLQIDRLVARSNLRFCTGNLLKQLGFKFAEHGPPESVMVNKNGSLADMAVDSQQLINQSCQPLWDCGHDTYIRLRSFD